MKFLLNKKTIVNGGLILLSIGSMLLQNKSDELARNAMKVELKKEILKELGKDVVEVVTEEVTN